MLDPRGLGARRPVQAVLALDTLRWTNCVGILYIFGPRYAALIKDHAMYTETRANQKTPKCAVIERMNNPLIPPTASDVSHQLE